MRRFVIALFTLLCGAGFAQDQIPNTKWEPSYVVAPRYPKLAFQARVSGRATVEVKVADSGAVDTIIRFDGDKIFQKSSEEAAKAWMFQPSSHPNRKCKLIFVYTIMPRNAPPEDLTTRFTPPFQVEIRRETTEPTVLVDPAPDPPKRK
jgi:TonB family protein